MPMTRSHGKTAATSPARGAPLAFVFAVVSLSLIGASSLTGCGSVAGPDGPAVAISLAVDPTVTTPLNLVVKIAEESFSIDSAGSISTHAPRAGELPVDVRLLSESGDTLATVSITHSFADGASNWIHAKVGGPRPVGFCIGRLTVVPVRAPVSDTLFLADGSLPEGAVC
jgi:hypothetical protein